MSGSDLIEAGSKGLLGRPPESFRNDRSRNAASGTLSEAIKAQGDIGSCNRHSRRVSGHHTSVRLNLPNNDLSVPRHAVRPTQCSASVVRIVVETHCSSALQYNHQDTSAVADAIHVFYASRHGLSGVSEHWCPFLRNIFLFPVPILSRSV